MHSIIAILVGLAIPNDAAAVSQQALVNSPSDFAPGERNIQIGRPCVTGTGVFIPTTCVLQKNNIQGYFAFDCEDDKLFVSSLALVCSCFY